MPRRFTNTAMQSGYVAAEFDEPIERNYFMIPNNRDDFERGHRAFTGKTFREETLRLKRAAHVARMTKAGSKGLPKARPVSDW